MKTIAHALIALLLTITLSYGSSESHRKAAEELIKIVVSDEIFIQGFMLGFDPSLKQMKSLGTEDSEIEKVKNLALELANTVLKDPELKIGMRNIYVNALTEEELNQLIAFYNTPLGKKVLIEIPALMKKGGELGQIVTQKYITNFRKEVSKVLITVEDTPEE